MPARTLATLLAAVSGCATVPGSQAVRIATSHYASMNGVRVESGSGPVTCSRDTITGSHILRWYCRFESDSTQYELSNPIAFVVR